MRKTKNKYKIEEIADYFLDIDWIEKMPYPISVKINSIKEQLEKKDYGNPGAMFHSIRAFAEDSLSFLLFFIAPNLMNIQVKNLGKKYEFNFFVNMFLFNDEKNQLMKKELIESYLDFKSNQQELPSEDLKNHISDLRNVRNQIAHYENDNINEMSDDLLEFLNVIYPTIKKLYKNFVDYSLFVKLSKQNLCYCIKSNENIIEVKINEINCNCNNYGLKNNNDHLIGDVFLAKQINDNKGQNKNLKGYSLRPFYIFDGGELKHFLSIKNRR